MKRCSWAITLAFACRSISRVDAVPITEESTRLDFDSGIETENDTTATQPNIRGLAARSRSLEEYQWYCANGWYYKKNGQWIFWGYDNDCPSKNNNFVKVPTDTLTLVGDNGSPSYQFPLAKCEGDCDSDVDCKGNLICSKRNGYTAIPGCKGSGAYGKDYCTDATNSQSSTTSTDTLTIVGDNGSPSNVFPLGKCQGNCDNDNECKGNLVCFKRGGIEAVPGCQGLGKSGKDYCAEPSTSLGQQKTTNTDNTENQQTTTVDDDSSFMVRLYWESSYYWQDSWSEAWWCLECTSCDEFGLEDGWEYGCTGVGYDGSSCRAGHAIWIRKCKDKSRQFRWNVIKNSGSGDQVRASGSNLCLTISGNRFVQLQGCDKNNSKQLLFKRIDNINKFELRPYHQRNWQRSDAMCLSQLHHPKDKEMVGLHNCQEAMDHETVYWEDYYQ